MVEDNLRPSVLDMEEWSDRCSFLGVLAMDRSSCSMQEYTSSFSLKSGPAEPLQKEKKPTIIIISYRYYQYYYSEVMR